MTSFVAILEFLEYSLVVTWAPYTVRKNSRFSELRGATLGDLDPRLGFAPKNCEKSPDFGSTPN